MKQKIKTSTVYLPVDVKERLPIDKGNYPVCSKNKSTQSNSIDDLRFDGIAFNEIPNWDHLFWLEKKEDQIVMSKEEFKKIADIIWTASDYRADWEIEPNGYENIPPDKDTYINNLFE